MRVSGRSRSCRPSPDPGYPSYRFSTAVLVHDANVRRAIEGFDVRTRSSPASVPTTRSQSFLSSWSRTVHGRFRHPHEFRFAADSLGDDLRDFIFEAVFVLRGIRRFVCGCAYAKDGAVDGCFRRRACAKDGVIDIQARTGSPAAARNGLATLPMVLWLLSVT